MRALTVVIAVVCAAPGLAQAQETAPPAAEARGLDTMPRWSEFPAPPQDVPTAADIKRRVEAEKAKQRQLESEVAALVWDKQEPERIAGEARQAIASEMPAPVDDILSPQQLEAFVAKLRAEAAPPPVAD
jgi:hypothetical protein